MLSPASVEGSGELRSFRPPVLGGQIGAARGKRGEGRRRGDSGSIAWWLLELILVILEPLLESPGIVLYLVIRSHLCHLILSH